jgi:hypothetical protein
MAVEQVFLSHTRKTNQTFLFNKKNQTRFAPSTEYSREANSSFPQSVGLLICRVVIGGGSHQSAHLYVM